MRKMECFSVRSYVRGESRKPDPTNPSADRFQDTKDNLLVWLVGSGLRDYVRGYNVYKDIWEAGTGEQLLYANARIATVLISLLWRLSRGYFRLFHVE